MPIFLIFSNTGARVSLEFSSFFVLSGGHSKMEGIVKWFNRKKGYGFIQGDDGQDYFLHHTAIERGAFIRDNDRVSFEPVDGERGKQAQKVSVIGGSKDRGQERDSEEEPEYNEDSDEEPEYREDE